eukprot:1141198-Alexandrium_andersonii.AAC.1
MEGPAVAEGLCRGVLASGNELTAFHHYWAKASGGAPRSAVAQEHTVSLRTLAFFLEYDRLNPA